MRTHPGWRSPLSVIRDSISWSSGASHVRDTSFAVLDQLQFFPPAVQLDALFVTAVAMATTIGKDPHEMVARARRILPTAEAYSDHLRALRDYASGELRV